MADFEVLVALAMAGALFGPAILCAIAAIYDGYDCHRCLLRRVLRSAAFVAIAFFATMVSLAAAESSPPLGVRWDWLALLTATTLAFAASVPPGVAAYTAVFRLSQRLHGRPAPVHSPLPSPIRETGNPYQPPAG